MAAHVILSSAFSWGWLYSFQHVDDGERVVLFLGKAFGVENVSPHCQYEGGLSHHSVRELRLMGQMVDRYPQRLGNYLPHLLDGLVTDSCLVNHAISLHVVVGVPWGMFY